MADDDTTEINIPAILRERRGESTGVTTDAALLLGAMTIETLQEQNRALRMDLFAARKMMEQMLRPEPFTLSEVVGYKGGHFYALQIRNVFNEYPKVRVEVYLP